MELLLKIPVHSRVKKYLAFNLPEIPYRVSPSSSIGSLLISLIDRNQNYMPNDFRQEYDEVLPIIVSDMWVRYRGKDLTPFSIFIFNNTIDNMMREQLYTSLYMFRIMGKKVIEKEVIISFLRLHGISEDDFPYDTVKRDFNRFIKKKSQKSKLFGSGLSPKVFTGGVRNKLLYS